jgi:hypothetical protein
MKKIITLSLLIFILISCKSTKKIGEKFDESDNLPFFNKKLSTLKIEGSMSVDMPKNSANASMEVNINKLDEFKMNIFGPFGIEVAKLYSNAQKFVFLNSFQGEAFSGVPSSENLNKVANLSLSFADLISIMRCEIPSEIKNFKKINEEENNKIFVNKAKESGKELVYINKYGLLTKYQMYDNQNVIVFEVSFDDYRTTEKFKLAHSVAVSFPNIGGKIEIKVDKYTPNIELTNLEFNIPKSIKVKEIE